MHPAPHRPGPFAADDDPPASRCDLAVLEGAPVTLWHVPGTADDTRPLGELQLAPDRPVVVGRADGVEIEYLDPAYRPTPVVPGTGQSVLRSAGRAEDLSVSRGHFTLRAAAGGVVLVNGVPRRGGGVRPPLNGTRLVAPDLRPLAPGEEYFIGSGSAAVVALPNGSTVRIHSR
jgi:hypothetical protein